MGDALLALAGAFVLGLVVGGLCALRLSWRRLGPRVAYRPRERDLHESLAMLDARHYTDEPRAATRLSDGRRR